jgi:DNA-binding beta-propeller fold protein YncE
MGFPGQMAIGPNGNLYVADQAGAIDIFNPTSGAFLNQFGWGTLVTPTGLAFSSTGNLYVSDSTGGNGFVDEFDASGNFIGQTIAPGGLLAYPNAMTFGSDGNLYIADQNSGDIYQCNLTTFVLSKFASSNSGNVNLLFGPDGNLYVMTSFNGGTVDVFNGTTGAFIQVFGDTSTALGSGALGMAFAGGSLYVADSNGVDIVNGTTGNVSGNFVAVDGVNVVNPTFLTFQTSTIPEPSTFVFGALGVVALLHLKHRRQCAKCGD